MSYQRFYLMVVFCLCIALGRAQNVSPNPQLLSQSWTAQWLTCPGVAQRAYGVYHFRKTFSLGQVPAKFIINISADNRYRLFVNGTPVCFGPARGDLYNWYYESLDIAPYLKKGDNVLATLVWNMGEYAPVAQVSNQTAFVVQGDTENEKLVNTNSSWKVLHDLAYAACSLDNMNRLRTYMVIGPGDAVKGKAYPWGWETLGYNDSDWVQATQIGEPEPFGYGSDNMWTMVPRTIPLMQEQLQRLVTVRRTEGIQVPAEFLAGKAPLTIPANTKVSILFDQSFNTLAYPELNCSKGQGAIIKLSYAEALVKNWQKGNRNDIDGKELIGNYDQFEPDGGDNRLFRPLWQRGFRYLQLDISTGNEPLVINDLYGMYTGYPLVMKAAFSSSDASLQDIWTVGWRTARLCAGETYYDCPYYEQLQYEGDTRIQALISLYMTGDDRLVRKAINDFYNSRVPSGLTQGRYPSSRLQVIPPFSLYWVSMLHDYLLYRNDDAFVKKYLMAARGVLDWYENHIDTKRQMLGPMNWWSFTDWNDGFPGGNPPGANDGNSSVVTLQYVYTLQQAAVLFSYFKDEATATHYRALAAQLAAGTYAACFNQQKNEMGDTPDQKTFSQHAGAMGVLAGAIPVAQQAGVMKTVLSDSTLTQASFYYRFYLNLALKKAGMGNLYYARLQPWRDMLKNGLTTFAEKPDPTRSDCHAWSASPNYDFLATICGITPASPGFKKVHIEPQLGELSRAACTLPHPDGEIKVAFEKDAKGSLSGYVELPANISGQLIWNRKIMVLKGGRQRVSL